MTPDGLVSPANLSAHSIAKTRHQVVDLRGRERTLFVIYRPSRRGRIAQKWGKRSRLREIGRHPESRETAAADMVPIRVRPGPAPIAAASPRPAIPSGGAAVQTESQNRGSLPDNG
jgi:hypothetical protein